MGDTVSEDPSAELEQVNARLLDNLRQVLWFAVVHGTTDADYRRILAEPPEAPKDP